MFRQITEISHCINLIFANKIILKQNFNFFKNSLIKQYSNYSSAILLNFAILQSTSLFDLFKKLYFDGYSFIYPDTYSLIRLIENKAYYYYVNFWYSGHYGIFVPIHWHWPELSYLYLSIFFVFLGWLDVYFVPKLKKKYKWYDDYFGIYYTINPKEFFIGSGLEAILNMEMDRRALHVLMKKSENAEHRETFFDQFLEVNRQYLERMEEITYDFNYVFFTLYNEYTTFEQDMDYIFVAIFFPFGLLGAVYIYGKPFGVPFIKSQRFLMHVDDLRLVYGGDLSMFAEFFKRASLSFSEIISNYVFTNVWEAEGADDDKQYYFNFYWNDLLLEPESNSFVDKIFYKPEIPNYYYENENPLLIKQQLDFTRYRFLKHDILPAQDKYFVSTNSILVQPLTSINFHTTTLESVDKEATYPPFYEQLAMQAWGAPEEISVPWIRKSPIFHHMGDFFFELYTIDFLKSNKQIENYLKLSPGHISPYAFAPKWTHFGHLYTFLNPQSKYFQITYFENCYHSLVIEEDENNFFSKIFYDEEVNELFLELQTEVVVPSKYGGEFFDNVLPSHVRQDYVESFSLPNMWDVHSLLKKEGSMPISLDWSALVPFDRKLYGLPLISTMNSIKEQLKVYLFTQTYLDLLQSKYGGLLGKYMFSSIGNSLDFYMFSLQTLNVDFAWYERTHYVSFPDLTFDYNMLQDLHDDNFGFVKNKYSLFTKNQSNLMSSLTNADWYLAYDFDDAILQLMDLHKDVGENVRWPLYYDDEYYFDNKPEFPGFLPQSYSFNTANFTFLNKFWKTINSFLGADSIKYILYGLTFDSVNLYFTQKVLYPFFLKLPSLNFVLPETLIENSYWCSTFKNSYAHSLFYPALYYYQDYLQIPSFGNTSISSSFLWNYSYFEYKDPFENFDGHLNFFELEKYNFFGFNIDVIYSKLIADNFFYYQDYSKLYPSFENFLGEFDFDWCEWHPDLSHFWVKRDLFDRIIDQAVVPLYFEDFFGHVNVQSHWTFYLESYNTIYLFSKKQMYDKAESFINACFIFSGELYNPIYTNPFLEERTYTIQAQEFYFDLFVEQWDNYMLNPAFLYDMADRNRLMYEDCDVIYPELGETWSEVWPNWEDEEAIFPFLVYNESYFNWNFNDLYPCEPQEWSRFIFVEPYLRLVTSDMWTFDEEEVTTNLYDEPSRHPDGSTYEDVTFTMTNNQEYKDDDVDSPEFYDVDVYLEEYVIGWYEQELLNEFFSNSISFKDVDWLTLAALWTAGFDCDEEGTFHVNVVDTSFVQDPPFFLDCEDSSTTPVFWDDEEFDDSIFNSYYLPLADKKGAVRYRDHFFVMSNFAAYKVGLDFEDMPWYVDDITDYDADGDLLDWFMDHDPRYGSMWPHIGIDGDLNSFGSSYFEYAGFWDDSEDLEPYEVDWEDPDDIFLHDPYLETLQEPFVHYFPGPATYFLPEVFPTVAWHGYPIPLDENGWVSITWFWRLCSLNDINYGWNYIGSEYPCLILPNHNSFNTYFADTLGIFNQYFSGENIYQPYSIILDDTEYPYFHNPKEQGFGLNLDHYFAEHFLPEDVYIFENVPYNDAVLDDDPWDDEEDDEDVEEEDGEEFTMEDAGVDWDILTVGQEWAGEVYGFDEVEYVDDVEESELDEDIEDSMSEELDYIYDWNTFHKGSLIHDVLPLKHCIDNYTTPWYINSKMFSLNFMDYFNFNKYKPFFLEAHKETLTTKWYFRRFYSKIWNRPELVPIYDLKDDWDRFLDRWYGYAVYWHTQNSRPWPHYYINQPITDPAPHPSEPLGEQLDLRLLTKEQWYKYFSNASDSQYEHPVNVVWDRYSFLRTWMNQLIAEHYTKHCHLPFFFTLLEKPDFLSKSTFLKSLKLYESANFSEFPVGPVKSTNLWDKFKEELFKEEYLNYRHLKLLPKHNLSLTFNEEKKFVLNFIGDINTEWEQMTKHNYPMDSDTIETLNIDFQQLSEGSLDCFLRYDFNIKRLDSFLYNDFLCFENNFFDRSVETLSFVDTLRFEYWHGSFEHFVYFRFVFFVGQLVGVPLDILTKYSYWFFWNQHDINLESNLSYLFLEFLCFFKYW